MKRIKMPNLSTSLRLLSKFLIRHRFWVTYLFLRQLIRTLMIKCDKTKLWMILVLLWANSLKAEAQTVQETSRQSTLGRLWSDLETPTSLKSRQNSQTKFAQQSTHFYHGHLYHSFISSSVQPMSTFLWLQYWQSCRSRPKSQLPWLVLSL